MRLRALIRRASTATVTSQTIHYGSLCVDHTFSRVLGTRNVSEPILTDLISAWRLAQTGDKFANIESVEICDRTVHPGAAPHSKGELVVDVRAAFSDESFLVEVQHRVEARFPHRAVIYAAAEIVASHVKNPGAPARGVHSLSFCDYDFQDIKKTDVEASFFSVKSSNWRASVKHEGNEQIALQFFGLHPSFPAMKDLVVHPALARELSERISFLFALLPHVPRLENLTRATPPLLRWASLVAHAAPDNLHTVPKDVRVGGVARLLEVLNDTKDVTQKELFDAELEKAAVARSNGDVRAEGVAEGEAKGKAEILRALGVTSSADFRSRYGVDAPPGIAEAFGEMTPLGPN